MKTVWTRCRHARPRSARPHRRSHSSLPAPILVLAPRTGTLSGETLTRMRPTVLIVDDHPGFRTLARALLDSEGFAVVGEAEDGTTAIDAVQALRPSVVLLDIQLPDLDGFEVA